MFSISLKSLKRFPINGTSLSLFTLSFIASIDPFIKLVTNWKALAIALPIPITTFFTTLNTSTTTFFTTLKPPIKKLPTFAINFFTLTWLSFKSFKRSNFYLIQFANNTLRATILWKV